jgi:phosphate transport system permease protein
VKDKTKNSTHSLPGDTTELAHSILKKQFRFSDWFAERVIKTVAFLSITIVALIFVFVFRETLPLFHAQNKENVTAGNTAAGSDGGLQPESYSSGEPESADLKPETYGALPDSTPEIVKDSVAIPEEITAYIGSLPQSENQKAIGTFLSRDWQPVSEHPRYGLVPLFFGTLKVTLIAILFAAPISILAALYTAMFAPKKIREYIKPAVELLAGFPSVVIGFFALMILASFFQDLLGYSGRLNAFVGGIAMALAAIPVIYTLTEDALSAVPKTYMEASLGLGASLRQTAFSVILPAATPGIFAAVLLGIGRVFGETMIALMATGNAALITANPFDSVRTLSATIGAEMAEVVFGDTHYSVLFLIGSLLFIFTFILNALAEFYFRNRLIRRFQGKQS